MFDAIANESLWCKRLSKLSDLSGVSVDASLLYNYTGADAGPDRFARIRTLDQSYFLSANDNGVMYKLQLSEITFGGPIGEAPSDFSMTLTLNSDSIFTVSGVVPFTIPHSVIR